MAFYSTVLFGQANSVTNPLIALLQMPAVWATCALAIGLWCLIPQGRKLGWLSALGWVLVIASVGLFAVQVPLLPELSMAVIFWLLASITIVAAVAMITSRSPVYSAIWFALSLLGTAGLFLLNGAQFIGIATVVVYAGAIVVMFLFLIMLAQPDGFEYYDRITWSRAATMISAVAGSLVVLLMTKTFAEISPPTYQRHVSSVIAALNQLEIGDDETHLVPSDVAHVELSQDEQSPPFVRVHLNHGVSAPSISQQTAWYRSVNREIFGGRLAPAQFIVVVGKNDHVASPHHVAGLGNELFSQQLLSVEVVGTLLLVALVGAVAIVIRGREQETSAVES